MYTSVSLVPKRVFITYILWDFREPWIHSQALPVSSQAPSPICKECTITRKCHVCAPEDSTPPSKSIKVSKNCPKLIRKLHPPPPPPPRPSNQNWNSILKVRGTQNLYFNWPIKCSIVQGNKQYPKQYNMAHSFLQLPLLTPQQSLSPCSRTLQGATQISRHLPFYNNKKPRNKFSPPKLTTLWRYMLVLPLRADSHVQTFSNKTELWYGSKKALHFSNKTCCPASLLI